MCVLYITRLDLRFGYKEANDPPPSHSNPHQRTHTPLDATHNTTANNIIYYVYTYYIMFILTVYLNKTGGYMHGGQVERYAVSGVSIDCREVMDGHMQGGKAVGRNEGGIENLLCLVRPQLWRHTHAYPLKPIHPHTHTHPRG